MIKKNTPFYEPANHQEHLNGIDLMKFLCSLLVFIIHVPPFPEDTSLFATNINFVLQNYLCRVAVPFYFVCSGFFLFRKMSISNLEIDVIRNYCFKILRLAGTWQLLLFFGDTSHLWYLGASVVAIILLSLCFHFHVNRNVWLLAIGLYCIGLLGDSYSELTAPLNNIPVFELIFKLYNMLFHTTRNGVFMGFLFVLMGAHFSNCKTMLKPIPAMAGLCLSLIGLSAEVFFLRHYDIAHDYNMLIFLVPTTYFLFSFAYSIPLKMHPIYTHLRNTGMLIYFSHFMVNRFILLALSVVDKYWHLTLQDHAFIFTFVATILFATFVEWLSTRNRFGWLRWLIA